MTDLINLPYWNVLKVQETDLNYVIDATYEIGLSRIREVQPQLFAETVEVAWQ